MPTDKFDDCPGLEAQFKLDGGIYAAPKEMFDDPDAYWTKRRAQAKRRRDAFLKAQRDLDERRDRGDGDAGGDDE